MIRRRRQLGDANQTAASVVNAGGAVTATAITTAATSGAIATSTAALAIPIVGAVVAGVAIWLSIISRKNAQKSASTGVMYQIQEQAEKNLKGYLEGPRTASSQKVALQNIDGLIALLKSPQGCGNPELGDAGRRCWTERATQEGPYSWYPAFRDPIANDTPNPDPPGVLDSAADTLTSFATGFANLLPDAGGWMDHLPLLAIAGLAAVALSD
jgi:hypothetical protein